MRCLGLIGMLALCCLSGCESTALSLDDPSAYPATLEPEYIEGSEPAQLLLAFDDVSDVGDVTGESSGWQVSIVEFGAPGLYLAGYRFISNFQIEITVALEDPEGSSRPIGQHDLVLQVTNHYGTFETTASLLVFP